jgi:hypothetical protein
MPFIDVDKFKADQVPSVQTPVGWETLDESFSGKLVVRGDGGLNVEVLGDTQNAAEIDREMSKKIAVTILRNQGFEVKLEKAKA